MWLSREIALLLAAGAIRNLGFGFYNIIFAIYLSKLGYDTLAIGTVLTLSSISGVIQTLFASVLFDRFPRKHVMICFGSLTFFSSLVFAVTSDPVWVATMAAVGLLGARAGGSGAGGLGGPVMVGQTAMLADESPPRHRNMIFAVNAIVLTIAGSLGALMAVIPDVLQKGYELQELDSYRAVFGFGSAMSLLYIVTLLFFREDKTGAHESNVKTEPAAEKSTMRSALIPEKSRKFIAKMGMLGALDSFGAGLHSSLLSYWFFVVHNASLSEIGPLFAISNLGGSVTLIIGAKLADKIGNVNATVLTHLPAPLLLILLPFAPDFKTAAIIQIVRQSISRMDSPIKQSYMMSIVPREERGRARGITAVFQRLPSSFAPSAAAYLMAAVSTSFPFYIGGMIQFAHDIMYYFTFRNIKPPEERVGEVETAASERPEQSIRK